jgi:3-oxoacyl-[acyl-carrier protein] reductase
MDGFGAIHILVNNAGNVRDKSFLKMTDEDFSEVLRVHVLGTFLCGQEAALRMRDQGTGGSIVNTVSAAHFGNFGRRTTPLAVRSFHDSTPGRASWPLRIRVNAVSPAAPPDKPPPPRWGARRSGPFDPTRNGAFVAFLCSDEANWVTGQIFGTGADRVVILEQPRYGTGMFKPDGWSVEDLRKSFKGAFGTRLEPFGLMKEPYPFYAGVNPGEK